MQRNKLLRLAIYRDLKMTNITELKEKLTRKNDFEKEWEYQQGALFLKKDQIYDLRKNLAEYFYRKGHSQDAKTITALLDIIEDMQDAIKHTNDFCLCTRNTVGFDYHEDHKVQGKPKSGSRWITPRDYNRRTLTATEQKLKNLTEEK